MTRDEAIDLLRGAAGDPSTWNARRPREEALPSLASVDLAKLNLRAIDLSEADLRGSTLAGANLEESTLDGAQLSRADLSCALLNRASLQSVWLDLADLSGAELRTVNLDNARAIRANFTSANLSSCTARTSSFQNSDLFGVDLTDAVLTDADFTNASLREARLDRASFINARLDRANLAGASVVDTRFSEATFVGTVLADLDLSRVHSLDDCHQPGPSNISTSTLSLSRGRIPQVFLERAGLQTWEVIAARLYDPDVTAPEIAETQDQVFRARAAGPLLVGGVFISYAQADGEFVDSLEARFIKENVRTWRDKHDLIAGPLERQILRGIRVNDAVVIVLSRSSVASDWVAHEIELARRRERDEERELLCPIAIDGAWKEQRGVMWTYLKSKAILDFSSWRVPDVLETEFAKLLTGLRIYYS